MSWNYHPAPYLHKMGLSYDTPSLTDLQDSKTEIHTVGRCSSRRCAGDSLSKNGVVKIEQDMHVRGEPKCPDCGGMMNWNRERK